MMYVYMLIGLNVVFIIQKTHKLYLILKYLIMHKADEDYGSTTQKPL